MGGYSMQKVSGRVYWRYWSMMILILFWSSLMTKTHHCWWLMLCQNFSACKLSILLTPLFWSCVCYSYVGRWFWCFKGNSRTCRGERKRRKIDCRDMWVFAGWSELATQWQLGHDLTDVHWKLAWQCKIPIFNRKYIFNRSIFHKKPTVDGINPDDSLFLTSR